MLPRRGIIWPADIDAFPRDHFTGWTRPTMDDVRRIGARPPAELDARGWPFLCLYSRIHEHRTDALAMARAPVTGGIRIPPRIIPLPGHANPPQFQGRFQFPPNSQTITEVRALPLTPIWPGLILNTLIYATALWLLTLGPLRLRRALRTRKGHCPHCAYDLNNLTTDRCPECGRPIAHPAAKITQDT
ncbi:MAG: hypothetical protein ACTS3F_09415 [Phycisphaerales bacterium]